MIKGITVELEVLTKVDTNPFGEASYNKSTTYVSNILVTPVTNEDIVNELTLSGKKIAYQLAIPKGDTHEWCDREVSFFGETFRTFGAVEQGIEANIPLAWNKKVKVERIE